MLFKNPGINVNLGTNKNPGVNKNLGINKNPGVNKNLSINKNSGVNNNPGVNKNPAQFSIFYYTEETVVSQAELFNKRIVTKFGCVINFNEQLLGHE